MQHSAKVLPIDRSRPAPTVAGPSGERSRLLTLAEGALAILRAAGSAIIQIDGDLFVVKAAAGTLAPLAEQNWPVTDSLAARALVDRRVIVRNDPRADSGLDRRFVTRFNVRHVAIAPWHVDHGAHGVILAINSTRGSFSEVDEVALTHFARLASLTLGDFAAVAALQRRNERLVQVTEARYAITGESLEACCDEVFRVIDGLVDDVSDVALFLTDAERPIFTSHLLAIDGHRPPSAHSIEVPIDDCTAGRAFRTDLPARSAFPRQALRELFATPARLAPASELALPVRDGDALCGVLVVQSHRVGAFLADDADILGIIARQTGAAIVNARRLELLRQARYLTDAGAAIVNSVRGVSAIATGAAAMLETVDRLIPSAGFALGLVDESATTLDYVATRGTLDSLRQLRLPVATSAAALVAGSAVIVATGDDVTALGECTALAAGTIVLPLVVRNHLVGVLLASASGTPTSDAAAIAPLASLASYLALAIEALLAAEADRRARARERMLATALATMDQPVFVLGPDRRVLYANGAAARAYGYTTDEFLAFPFDGFVQSTAPARRLGVVPYPSAASVWTAEHVHRHRDGTSFPVSVVLSYIRDDSGIIVGQVLNIRSLLEERRLEEQLRQSEKLAAIGELVAGVAHELNNPLTGISAFAQLMLDEQLSADQHESVRLIKREADRAVSVIRDLLLFSRKSGPTRVATSVNEIVELTIRLRAYSLRTTGVSLVTHLEDGAPRINADPQKLQQVLLNLIVNAEYALQRAPVKRLTISTRAERDGVAIVVADTGGGMTEETRQRVFEPFFTTKPAGHGTGLGLSVSYGIVRSHGGTIEVKSRPAQGTVFTIFLPVTSQRPELHDAADA